MRALLQTCANQKATEKEFAAMHFKEIIRSTFAYLAVIYLAFVGVISIILNGGSISEGDDTKTTIIFLLLILSVIIRSLKIKIILLFVTITLELILISFTVEEVFNGNLIEVTKNIILEPGVTLIIISYVLIVWDWTNRVIKLKSMRANISHD